MSYTCSWPRPDACSQAARGVEGPRPPCRRSFPHEIQLFSSGNPFICLLTNQIALVHLGAA